MRILVTTEHLWETGRRWVAEAEQLRQAGRRLATAAGDIEWEGRTHLGLADDLAAARQRGEVAARGLEELGRRLLATAERFDQADRGGAFSFRHIPWGRLLQPPAMILPAIPAAGTTGGVVLAAMTAVVSPDEWAAGLTWEQRFAQRDALAGQIADLQKQIDALRGQLPDGKTLEEVERELADLRAQRDDLMEKADHWWNKVLPPQRDDGWVLQWDDDGLPWRVQADDYEDQIVDLDRQIAELEGQKRQLAELGHMEGQLAGLRAQQQALDRSFQNGVPADGPTRAWLRKRLGGCTHYVAEKRDVYAWPNSRGEPGHPGNASAWDEQARAAGYEVGSRPVKGAIVVFDQGAQYKADQWSKWYTFKEEAGHVAYVEDVDYSNPDVVRFKISEAGYEGQMGSHGPVSTHWVTVKKADVEAGRVEFVYDRPAGAVGEA